MKLSLWAAVAAACLSSAVPAVAQDAAKEQLRVALKDTEPQGSWIYDDLAAGYSEAGKSGKPMLVVFR